MAWPDGQGRSISLWWIGEGRFDAEMLDIVAAHVAQAYACEVSVTEPAGRPDGTLDPRRGQHSSRGMLTWVLAQAAPGERVLGITDVDLFIPILTFVFGEAQLEGNAAVVSFARLIDAGSRQRTIGRLAREAVHELGHTFGLMHCSAMEGQGRRAAPCVMSRSASVRAVDEKSPRLCGDCRARYLTFQQDGAHVYREHQNPHR